MVDSPPQAVTAQDRFVEHYITADEIAKEAKVSRVSVSKARQRGLLPDAVLVGDYMYIWERASVRPYLDSWKTILTVRRGNTE